MTEKAKNIFLVVLTTGADLGQARSQAGKDQGMQQQASHHITVACLRFTDTWIFEDTFQNARNLLHCLV